MVPLFIKKLNLEDDVKDRFLSFIREKNFRVKVVPFMMSLEKMYNNKSNEDLLSFNDYVREQFKDQQDVVGMDHELFTFIEKVEPEKEKSKLLSDANLQLGALVVNMFDILHLQKDITEKDKVKRSLKLMNTLFMNAHNLTDSKDLHDGIKTIMADPIKKETVVLTLNYFVKNLINRHYKMWEDKEVLALNTKDWLERGLDSFIENDDSTVVDYMNWGLNDKKYAVHYIVDGLQGHLMESLSGNNPQFRRQVLIETLKHKNLLPKGVKSQKMIDQDQSFLEQLSYSNIGSEPKYLPLFKSLYNNKLNKIATNGLSTSPTISVRNLPIVMTGHDVTGEHSTGLPNFHYIDRQGVDREDSKARAYYFYGNDAMHLDKITTRSGMKTPFEWLKKQGLFSLACNTNYDKGALKSFDAFLNLAVGEKLRDFGEVNCTKEINDRIRNEKEINEIRTKITSKMNKLKKKWKYDILGVGKYVSNQKIKVNLKALFKRYAKLLPESLPSYIQIYNPWPDHFAHYYGPFSNAIVSYTGELNRLDYWLSQVDSSFRNSPFYDKTLFGMAGDHGLAPIYSYLNPEVEVFERLKQERGIDLKVKKISSDEGEGPKMNHPEKFESMKNYDVVIASTAGGNFMIDLFKDQDNNWICQPIRKEIQKLETLSGETINMEDTLLEYLGDSLEYMVIRNFETNTDFTDISLIANREGIKVVETILRDKDKIFYKGDGTLVELGVLNKYRVLSQEDKNSYESLKSNCVDEAIESDKSTWCDQDTWIKLTGYTNKPGSVPQLAHLYDSDKAGTINLFPKFGIGYNTTVPGRHAGEHFHEKDAFVGFWGAQDKSVDHFKDGVNGQLVPTFYEYLTGDPAEQFSFDSLMDHSH